MAPDLHAPMLRSGDDPCGSCGAALAADQRYCLECGARCGARRLDPLAVARTVAVAHGGVPARAGVPDAVHAAAGHASPAPPAAAGGEPAPGWATLPPAALALGRPRVAAAAAATVLLSGALLGSLVTPAPQSAAAQRLYVAGGPRHAAVAAAAAAAGAVEPDASAESAPADDGGDSGSSDLATADAGGDTDTSAPAATDEPAASGGDGSGDDTMTEDDTAAARQPGVPTSPAPVKRVWLIALEGVDVAAQAATPGAAGSAVAAPAATPSAAAPAAAANALRARKSAAATAPASPAATWAELAAGGTLLTRYSSLTRGSLANSVALVSGLKPTPEQAANCAQYSAVTPGTVTKSGLVTGSGCVEPAEAPTLADLLTGAGLVWRTYAEDIGAGDPGQTSCRHPELASADPFTAPRPADAYLTWRNPFVYFRSITDSADCGTAVVGLDRLAPDLAAATDTPAFWYVIPSACHDGSPAPCREGAPAGPEAALTWLAATVAQIQASDAYADGGLIVVTSPDGPRSDAVAGDAGVPVGALLLSPYVGAGTSSPRAYDHLDLLRTLAAFFGVRAPARSAGKDVRVLDSALFPGAPAAGES